MGMLMAGLSIAQGAMGVASGFAQASQAQAVYDAQVEASNANLEILYDDISRQKEEARLQAQEAMSDRVLQANADIATTTVLASQRGLSNTSTLGAVRSLAMIEGVDNYRTRKTYEATTAALDSQLDAGEQQAANVNLQAANQAAAASQNAIWGGFGSALQIGADYTKDWMTLQASTNKGY